MELELSDGTFIKNPTRSNIDDAISKIGSGLDHCILSDGGNYIQTAGGSNQLLVQYNEDGAIFESTSGQISAEQVKEIFQDYLAGGNSWKTMIPFQGQEDGQPGTAQPTGVGSSTPLTERSLKDTLTSAAKQEAVNSVSYMIRRIVRRFFRKIF